MYFLCNGRRTLAPVTLSAAATSRPKPRKVSLELGLASICIHAKVIGLVPLKLPDFCDSLPQVLAGIGETAPASVDNRRLRPYRRIHGEPTHLLSPALHPLTACSSTPEITGVLRRRRLSPESLRWPSNHTAATVEFPLVLWFD
jgi:hypothetical protein